MSKRLALSAAALVLLAAGALFGRGLIGAAPASTGKAGDGAAAGGEPPQTVATVVARTLAWQPQIEVMGNLRALNGADLSFETAGVLDSISFASGQDVARGAVLARLRLDDEPARLAQLRAEADLAAVNLNRDTKQFQAQAVSHAIVDQDHATLLADQAQVAAEQALMAEKTLVAPFAGRLGVREVDLGQFLQPGTKVVTLQALDPIAADFFVPEQDAGLLRLGETVTVATGARGGPAAGAFAVAAGAGLSATVTAITPQVDQASRTVLVRAVLRNADRRLVPGTFVNVTVGAGPPAERVTLPEAAIAFAPYGDTVFVVRRDAAGHAVAHQVLVRAGETRGDQVAILSGISAGDTVVSAGQTKLHEGTPVVTDNAIEPDASAAPHVTEE